MVTLADDGVEMRLAPCLVLADAALEDTLGLFNELAVEIDGVGFDAAGGVVLPEDELGGLEVVLVHLAVVGFALVGELLCGCAVAIVVSASGLEGVFVSYGIG